MAREPLLTFSGYPRPDGAIGVRNHILVLSTVACANSVTERIASHSLGVTSVTHQHGCTMLGADADQFRRTLLGFAVHPNVGGVFVVGLGCELIDANELASIVISTGRPFAAVLIQKCGGETRAVRNGLVVARQLIAEVRRCPRELVSLSHLTLATECGASDYTYGLSANPVNGWVSNQVVRAGGSVFISETTEMIGAEHILSCRAVSDDVHRGIRALVQEAESAAVRMSVDIRGSQPTPGNMRGCLTTIEEKSLDCLQKGGSSEVRGVTQYASRLGGRGLWIMDTPGQDVESITGMVAGGSQVVLFSTGLGTPSRQPHRSRYQDHRKQGNRAKDG